VRTKVVFFDAGETLVYRNPSLATIIWRRLKRAGYAKDRAILKKIIEKAALGMRKHVRRAGMSDSEKWRVYIRRVFSALGIKDDGLEENVRETLKQGASFRPFKDAKAVAFAIKRRGIKVGIISNASRNLPAMLKRTGLYRIFNHVIVSEEEGFEKPDSRIFMRALEIAGVKPNECVYVGDNFLADVEGAKRAGIRPVWLRRKSKNAEFSFSGRNLNGVFVIRKLSELPGLLKKEGLI